MAIGVTQIKRRATEIIDALGDDPLFVTEHGERKAVLMSSEAYERLQRKIRLLEGIARGERAIRDGRTVTQGEAEKRLAKWR
jgi:prevent-host-death family protein